MKTPAFALRPLQWLNARGQRERTALLGGALLLTILLGWELLLQPGLEWLETRKRLVTDKTQTLAWMQQSAAEVIRLKSAHGNTPAKGVASGESLLALADRTAKEKGLGRALQRVEPDGEERVRLWFEKVAFDGLMGWMTQLADQHGARVENITLDREEEPGLVRARVVLAWPDKVGNRGPGK